MPLTPDQKKELAELDELEHLEKRFGAKQAQPEAKGFSDKFEAAMPDWVKKAVSARGAFTGNMVNAATLGNFSPPGTEQFSQENPKTAMAGKVAGMIVSGAALGGATSALGAGMGAAGRIGLGVGQGAATGFASKPQGEDSLEARGKGAGIGALLGGGLSAAGEAVSGAGSKLADFLMQKAVGRGKYTPGVGNSLVDEGLVGTKGMLKNQVEDKIASHGADLESAVSQIPSKIDSDQIAAKVAALGGKYTAPGGVVPEAVQPEMNAITSRSQDIANRGASAPGDALKYKRIAALEGYKDGTPLAGFNANLAKTESGAYGKALEDAYAQANPGAANAVADKNQVLSNLYKAQKGLGKEGNISAGLPLSDLALGAGGAAIGAASDHDNRLSGALKGILLSQALKSKAIQSGGAQVLQKGGQLVNDPTLHQIIMDASLSKK